MRWELTLRGLFHAGMCTTLSVLHIHSTNTYEVYFAKNVCFAFVSSNITTFQLLVNKNFSNKFCSSNESCIDSLLNRDKCTVKSRFRESQFSLKSQFKEQNLVTKMEFHIKKSRFKESKCADGGHSLNPDFTVLLKVIIRSEKK